MAMTTVVGVYFLLHRFTNKLYPTPTARETERTFYYSARLKTSADGHGYIYMQPNSPNLQSASLSLELYSGCCLSTRMNMSRSKALLCPSPAHVKYVLIAILLIIMIQYPDIVAGKHAQTTRHYKFNVSTKLFCLLVMLRS